MLLILVPLQNSEDSLVKELEYCKTLIDTIIGDAAYSEKGNIEYTKEKNIKLVAKLNSAITQGARAKEDKFEFNKDAGMYVCKAGHMAYRKSQKRRRNQGALAIFAVNMKRIIKLIDEE